MISTSSTADSCTCKSDSELCISLQSLHVAPPCSKCCGRSGHAVHPQVVLGFDDVVAGIHCPAVSFVAASARWHFVIQYRVPLGFQVVYASHQVNRSTFVQAVPALFERSPAPFTGQGRVVGFVRRVGVRAAVVAGVFRKWRLSRAIHVYRPCTGIQ